MGFKSSGCCCGVSPRLSAVNSTLSFYIANDTPTPEIDQAIGWLNGVKRDCDFKIDQLNKIKKRREASQDWRNNMNAIAKRFCDPDALHLDSDIRAKIIKQRLGCDDKKAHHLADIVTRWANNEIKRRRDKTIFYQKQAGLSATEIARQNNLTRQQVYNILKKLDKVDMYR